METLAKPLCPIAQNGDRVTSVTLLVETVAQACIKVMH